ncbi:hypothetical protein AML48_08325 [Escherichia coli]|nr:hypothetical protein AML48_08325 [Escherichia coli]
MKPLGYPEQNCEQGGCFVLSGCHEAARPPGADLRTRGLFYSVGISEIRLASRSRTANKGVVLSCQSVRNTLCHPEQDCEQGGCFALPGYQKAAGPPEACNANKGVVLSCRAIRKLLVHPEPDCEQGGCFILPGYQKAAGPPGAGLRTRGLFYPVGLS